ncbi:MAG: PRC-barrel domain-containing protein [Acidobacteriota bacterium]|nr:PRC-barrel domain-containing protein [Acidobacteriota bacterium]
MQRVLAAGTLAGDRVRNSTGEDLGRIEEIMIDIDSGRVAYAVLSFGGFLGIGDKLFAVPWEALTINTEDREFVLNVDRQVLEDAPGFDKDKWPDMADADWSSQIHGHYGKKPYRTSDITDTGDYVGDDRLDKAGPDKPNRDSDFEAVGTDYRPKGHEGESTMPNSTKTEQAPSGHTHYVCEKCGEHFHSQAELSAHEAKCDVAKRART